MRYLEQTIAAGETVKGEYYLPAVFMRMIRDGYRLRAPEIDEWLDCGKPETLLETNRYLLRERHHMHGTVIDSVLIPPVHLDYGATARLHPRPQCSAARRLRDRGEHRQEFDHQRRLPGARHAPGVDPRRLGAPCRRFPADEHWHHSLIEMEG
jgi:glucose-1-phosphate thymidylyltransferase